MAALGSVSSLSSSVLAGSAGTGATEGGVNVDFDATILVQIALIVVLLVFLKPLLFDPLMKLFEEREKKIDGAKLQARRMDEKSATALEEYEDAMAKARATAGAERERQRAEGTKEEAEILENVRKKTEKAMEEGRQKIEMDLAAARAELKRDAESLARDVATRILGREVH
jgi:F-type H+-transporting ATPase subunit b